MKEAAKFKTSEVSVRDPDRVQAMLQERRQWAKENDLNADVIEAENIDRHNVYMDIAKKNGLSLEIVEKRRVLQISKKANPGTWLQRENGSWYRK